MAYDLETLSAKLEIQELETRYTWAIDQGQVELLADLFPANMVLTVSPGDTQRTGFDDVQAWYRDYCHEWRWENRRHYMANVQVEVDGYAARCRAYFLLTYEVHGKSRIGWGNYDDTFTRRDGRWWFARKNIFSAGPVSLDKGWAGVTLPPFPADWR